MRIITTFCLLLFSAVLFGQQYDANTDSDPKAVEILEQIKDNFFESSGHQMEFSLEMEFPGHATETQDGNLTQSRENFVLDMADRKIISDNTTVWMYIKEMNEVQISDMEASESTDFMTPSDIFNLYQSKEFVFAILNYGQEEGKAVTQIECKPLSEDSDYSKMRLTVLDGDLSVKRLKIFSKDGARYTMHIRSHNADYKVSPDAFTFDPADYPGVYVEDLRF